MAELTVGLLLLAGFGTRFAAGLGILLMMTLTVGQGMLREWGEVASQLVYAIGFALILFLDKADPLSVDYLRRPKQQR